MINIEHTKGGPTGPVTNGTMTTMIITTHGMALGNKDPALVETVLEKQLWSVAPRSRMSTHSLTRVFFASLKDSACRVVFLTVDARLCISCYCSFELSCICFGLEKEETT